VITQARTDQHTKRQSTHQGLITSAVWSRVQSGQSGKDCRLVRSPISQANLSGFVWPGRQCGQEFCRVHLSVLEFQGTSTVKVFSGLVKREEMQSTIHIGPNIRRMSAKACKEHGVSFPPVQGGIPRVPEGSIRRRVAGREHP